MTLRHDPVHVILHALAFWQGTGDGYTLAMVGGWQRALNGAYSERAS
jgi:hypothetical protein